MSNINQTNVSIKEFIVQFDNKQLGQNFVNVFNAFPNMKNFNITCAEWKSFENAFDQLGHKENVFLNLKINRRDNSNILYKLSHVGSNLKRLKCDISIYSISLFDFAIFIKQFIDKWQHCQLIDIRTHQMRIKFDNYKAKSDKNHLFLVEYEVPNKCNMMPLLQILQKSSNKKVVFDLTLKHKDKSNDSINFQFLQSDKINWNNIYNLSMTDNMVMLSLRHNKILRIECKDDEWLRMNSKNWTAILKNKSNVLLDLTIKKFKSNPLNATIQKDIMNYSKRLIYLKIDVKQSQSVFLSLCACNLKNLQIFFINDNQLGITSFEMITKLVIQNLNNLPSLRIFHIFNSVQHEYDKEKAKKIVALICRWFLGTRNFYTQQNRQVDTVFWGDIDGILSEKEYEFLRFFFGQLAVATKGAFYCSSSLNN